MEFATWGEVHIEFVKSKLNSAWGENKPSKQWDDFSKLLTSPIELAPATEFSDRHPILFGEHPFRELSRLTPLHMLRWNLREETGLNFWNMVQILSYFSPVGA